MDPERDIDEILDELRHGSPLPVLMGVLFGSLMLAVMVNLLTNALYELWFDIGAQLLPQMDSFSIRALCGTPLLIILVFAIAVASSYLYQLSRRQEPSVHRKIVLVLVFARREGKVMLQELRRLRCHRGMAQALNWAVEKAAAKGQGVQWHGGWMFGPGQHAQSPMTGDAVTLVYDLTEWMLLNEVADFGEHLYAGQGKVRPGDDFLDQPTEIVRKLRKDLYQGHRVNFVGKYGNQFDTQVLKLPAGTNLSLEELPRRHGVERYGKEPVRQVVVTNPAGRLIVTPSQIWRRVSGQQAQSLLDKQFKGQAGGDVYYLELLWMTEVRLRQGPFAWPWSSERMVFYQRWLLELQEQMVRHMDWARYVATDYQRMLVDVRDRVMALTEAEAPNAE